MLNHLMAIIQGRSSTKNPKNPKNVSHHVWPTEKILGFEWLKTTQIAMKFLYFFRKIFKYVQDFSCSSKQLLPNFFFLQGFFLIKIKKIKKDSVQNETM